MSNQTDELADVAWDDKTKPPKTMDRTHLEGVNTAMLVLTSLFFVAQLYIRISKRKPYELHAFFCYFSYICYVGMWVMYIEENKPLYRAEGVQRGEIPMYPEIRE